MLGGAVTTGRCRFLHFDTDSGQEHGLKPSVFSLPTCGSIPSHLASTSVPCFGHSARALWLAFAEAPSNFQRTRSHGHLSIFTLLELAAGSAPLPSLSFWCSFPLTSTSPRSFVFPPTGLTASQSFPGSRSSTSCLYRLASFRFHCTCSLQAGSCSQWLYSMHQWFSQLNLPSEPQVVSKCLSVSKVSLIRTELLQAWPSLNASST